GKHVDERAGHPIVAQDSLELTVSGKLAGTDIEIVSSVAVAVGAEENAPRLVHSAGMPRNECIDEGTIESVVAHNLIALAVGGTEVAAARGQAVFQRFNV